MISSIILNGIVKLISVRKDSNKERAVCRVYDLTSQVPSRVLEERIPGSGLFRDTETNKRFKISGDIVVPA